MTRTWFALSLWLIAAITPGRAMQLESARVTAPASVTFQVTDAYAQTTASGGALPVSFNQGLFLVGRVLRISVKADSDLTAAGGAPLLASGISWTTSNVASGVGTNGSLSTTVYTQVYQSDVGKKNGRVDLTFKLAPPGVSARAVTYVSTLRWKFEAVWP